jgi:BirA family transcriptional regulator, biotin operon repressor / biotin---[acetyl-CoA-carboxylase] ligase
MFTAMSGTRARSSLRDTRFADVRWVSETGSTNADLLAAARAGESEGVVLVADHQTAGRGRLGRTWVAPPRSSLLFSVLLRPGLDVDDLHLVTTALGVAATDALREDVGVAVGMKWPNDLVASTPDGDRKLAGILAESVVEGGRVSAVVVGMGCNVAWGSPGAEVSVPDEVAALAVALDQLGHHVDREDLLVAILGQMDRRYGALDTPEGRTQLHVDHLDRCVTLGRRVRVELAHGAVEGRAADLLPSWHLVVDPGGGAAPVEVSMGDVVHLR